MPLFAAVQSSCAFASFVAIDSKALRGSFDAFDRKAAHAAKAPPERYEAKRLPVCGLEGCASSPLSSRL